MAAVFWAPAGAARSASIRNRYRRFTRALAGAQTPSGAHHAISGTMALITTISSDGFGAPASAGRSRRCRAGLLRGRTQKSAAAPRARVLGSEDAPSRRSPGSNLHPLEFRRCESRAAVRFGEFPSIEELLHGDSPDAEWLGQVTVAEASLARHFARDNDGIVCLREESAPMRFAEDRQNRTLRRRRQLHRTRVAANISS